MTGIRLGPSYTPRDQHRLYKSLSISFFSGHVGNRQVAGLESWGRKKCPSLYPETRPRSPGHLSAETVQTEFSFLAVFPWEYCHPWAFKVSFFRFFYKNVSIKLNMTRVTISVLN